MKKRNLLCITLALSFVLSACAAKKSESYSKAAIENNASQETSISSAGMADNGAQVADAEEKLENQANAISDKKIITNANIYIEGEDLLKLSNSIQQKAAELGGYIESEEFSEYRLTTRVRIPAAKFDSFITYTEKGFTVKSKNVFSENITNAYVDNEARLNNLKAQEKQILEILKKANTVEEVLKVQAELYKVRGEAEALEARKKSWDRQVDYVSVTIIADKKQIIPDNKKTIISGNEFVKAISKGFINTAISLILFVQNLLIFIFSNILVIGLLIIAALFGYRKYKKYSKK
ncbi:DUF4349 domain-containing protein [Clostridium sp. SYSU_GA19001]|uniref:DUF4349 domain-containing protein n=1 Tax=Clostridium caldaquaticum TaxID=2940653 RepID=UPI002076EE32|nr:DUF4349 domain-containing protein [Clostridium caldaquaticum]MCM8709480.1 DUF4349 domain-containing protein [Clostridium caldaquaticum]